MFFIRLTILALILTACGGEGGRSSSPSVSDMGSDPLLDRMVGQAALDAELLDLEAERDAEIMDAEVEGDFSQPKFLWQSREIPSWEINDYKVSLDI